MLEHLIKFKTFLIWTHPPVVFVNHHKKTPLWGAWFDHGEARVSHATREVPPPPKQTGLWLMEEVLHHYLQRFVYIPRGAGFFPSTVWLLRDQYSQDNCLKRVYFLQCMVPGKVAKCSIAGFVGDVSFIAANCVSLSSMLHSNGSWSS